MKRLLPSLATGTLLLAGVVFNSLQEEKGLTIRNNVAETTAAAATGCGVGQVSCR